MSKESITLGGGCFWCLEAVYKEVRGVSDVESGYCNGHVKSPSYEQVCRGDTGHAEVVKLEFDADVISLEQLLEIFFHIHDPTTLNRQGNDVGTQYRSGIYCHSPEQLQFVRGFVEEMNAKRLFSKPVVTELTELANYSTAEQYHQDYFENHPGEGYCAWVVGPKVAKFQQTFRSMLKSA